MYKSKIFIFLFLLALIAFVVGIYFGKVEEISAFLALVGGTIAIVNYSRSVKIKRLEWLLQLFSSLYGRYGVGVARLSHRYHPF